MREMMKTIKAERLDSRRNIPNVTKMSQYVWESLLHGLAKLDSQGKAQDVSLLIACIHEAWPGPKDADRLFLPAELAPRGFPQFLIQFKSNSEINVNVGSSADRITIFLEKLLDATALERPAILLEIERSIYHEFEHIISGPADQDEIDERVDALHVDAAIDAKVRAAVYVCHPNEIAAYAREFAIAYARNFPGKKFDFANFEKIAPQLEAAATNYSNFVSQPDLEEKYGKYVTEIYGYSLAEAGTQFFTQLKKFIAET